MNMAYLGRKEYWISSPLTQRNLDIIYPSLIKNFPIFYNLQLFGSQCQALKNGTS